jgi:hypothetical protein
MSLQMSLSLTLNVTSLPELQVGHTPSDLQDGQMIGPCGQGRHHANLSARQAKEQGLMTSGTYGPRSFGSFNSVSLQQSLVNRLHQRMALDGGMLFRLTWKQRTTPAGLSIYALRALGRSTSDSASTGWPTPTCQDLKHHPQNAENNAANGRQAHLPHVGLLAPWPPPVANDDNKTPEAHLAMKQRMGERDGTGANRTQITSLQVRAKTIAPWITPATRDYKVCGQEFCNRRMTRPKGILLNEQAQTLGTTPSGSPVQTEKRGQLNGAFSRWLMGYPVEWDIAAILAHRQRKTRQKGG